jgi:ketosteroid isomerase-like protein
MNWRRSSLTTIAAALLCAAVALAGGGALSQQASDMDAVKGADQAFYAAFSAHDIAAMQKAWSSDADIQNIGPGSKAVAVGWDAIKKGFEGTLSNFPDIKLSMEQPRIKVNNSVAWVSGIEHAEGKDKAGVVFSRSNLVTNIFEKEAGVWLMVYHHASRMPQ